MTYRKANKLISKSKLIKFQINKNSSGFKKDVVWQGIGAFLQLALGMLWILLIGRQLGSTEYGSFAVITGVVFFFYGALEFRVGDIIAKEFAGLGTSIFKNIAYQKKIFYIFIFESLSKFVVCVLLLLFSCGAKNTDYFIGSELSLLFVCSIGMLIARLGVGSTVGLLRVVGKSKLQVLISAFDLALRCVILVSFIIADHISLQLCIYALCFSGIVCNIVQICYCMKLVDVNKNLLVSLQIDDFLVFIKQLKKFLSHNLGISITNSMNGELDVVILSFYLAREQVGIYKMGKNLSMLLWRCVEPINIAFMFESSRLILNRNLNKLSETILKSTRHLFLMSGTVALVIYCLVYLFYGDFLGKDYRGITLVVALMLIGIVIGSTLVWTHSVSVALGKTDIPFRGGVVTLLLGLVLFIFLVPLFGLYGAAISWSSAFASSFVYMYIRIRDLLSES